MRGGDMLWPEIERAIEAASAHAAVVSPESLQSDWVCKELSYALRLAARRGREAFPIVPLSLNGTKLGVLKALFGGEVLYIPVSSDPGGVEAAMNAILIALGQRLPADTPSRPQPNPQPLEELVLELSDLKFHDVDGKRRASARARLIYEPATPGQPCVHSVQNRRHIVLKSNAGNVRLEQHRYPEEALQAYAEARERFTELGEPGTLACLWHQTGMAYHRASEPEAAEDA